MSRREENRQALAESAVTPWVDAWTGDIMHPSSAVYWLGNFPIRLATPCSRCGRILDDLPGGECDCGGEA